MDVVLVKDVQGLGQKGDRVSVKNGYARNFLFPKGYAVEATKGALREHENLQSAKARKEERLLAEAEKLRDLIDGAALVFKAKAGQGRIFGSITSSEIANRIASRFKVKIDKRKILLKENLKELGKYEISVQLHPKVRADIIVEVRAEEDN